MRAPVLLALFIVFSAGLAGCISDGSDWRGDGEREDPWAREIVEYPLPDPVGGFEAGPSPEPNGTQGLWVQDGLAYLSGGTGLRIYDVADPQDPVLLAKEVEGTEGTRDVDVITHPNGRTYAVLGDNSDNMTFVDVSDPTDPVMVEKVKGVVSTHNIAVVPGTAVVYNSRSLSTHTPEPGHTGRVDMVDFSDPENPEVHVFDFPAVALTVGGVPRVVDTMACHDITFNQGLDRAYCAGVTQTLVWDVSDPLAPEILQVLDWPMTNIHHGAWDARDGDLLILGDEFVGVAAPTPMCHDAVAYPTSALWFIDISDLATPIPVGYFQIEWDALGASADAGEPVYCSTHFGQTVEGRDLFAVGWYTAGTALVDFSDPSAPVMVDHFRPEGGVSTWDARYWNGHLFTGDAARGMDIIRLIE